MDSDEKKKIVEVMKAKKGESNLDWMYKGMAPDTDDYLMGRKVDNYIEKKSETTKDGKFSTNFTTRIKTNVMMDSATQMREDPLFVMRKQEEEARRRILDNPIKMKQIQKMLKSQKKPHKSKKHKKSKKKKKYHDSDSDSSSSDSSDELVKAYLAIVKKKNKDQCDEEQNPVDKMQKSSHYGLIKSSSSHQSSERNAPRSGHSHLSHSNSPEKDEEKYKHKHKSHHLQRDSSSKHTHDSFSSQSKSSDHGQSRSASSHTRHRSRSPPTKKLNASDREKKLQEMMSDAKWRSDVRAHNVKVYEKECELDEKNTHKGSSSDFLNPMMSQHASQSSVEERIRRNKYNIQRTKSQLNANFTKR
ncbi:pre-mRNA-splicing factor CWC25 homolog [Octopus sinensis]|uniref:Pre-mRNA-splicing factor CWC25 homolog n=1 Tax=Octopus sinensis TaxID=2607531 RepID=A0A6P7SPN3_9MOLL|nr:pre-mRNA-splicing factor CWC25 homolog [Octopus sinensis]XP_036361336.1 pre-mRNA-splicing factor CWC25 homolog [Octopus sinensis]